MAADLSDFVPETLHWQPIGKWRQRFSALLRRRHAQTERVVAFFLERDEAEAMIHEVRKDEPVLWQGICVDDDLGIARVRERRELVVARIRICRSGHSQASRIIASAASHTGRPRRLSPSPDEATCSALGQVDSAD